MLCHHRPRLWLFFPGLLVDPVPSDPSLADGNTTVHAIPTTRVDTSQKTVSTVFYRTATEYTWSHTLRESHLGSVGRPVCAPWDQRACSHTWSDISSHQVWTANEVDGFFARGGGPALGVFQGGRGRSDWPMFNPRSRTAGSLSNKSKWHDATSR